MASPEPASPSPLALSTPPSTWYKPLMLLKLVLIAAFPNIIMPPQSPLCGLGDADVKTIGLSTVPSAINLEPLVMIRAPTSLPL